jgi:hypothetical protein
LDFASDISFYCLSHIASRAYTRIQLPLTTCTAPNLLSSIVFRTILVPFSEFNTININTGSPTALLLRQPTLSNRPYYRQVVMHKPSARSVHVSSCPLVIVSTYKGDGKTGRRTPYKLLVESASACKTSVSRMELGQAKRRYGGPAKGLSKGQIDMLFK